jgi:hypothetical protein
MAEALHMKDIASIRIVWNGQGQLLLDYSGQANIAGSLLSDYLGISVPLFCANQMYVLKPLTCLQLCQGINEIVVGGNLSPHPIDEVLKEARLELKEISSDAGDKLLVAMFHPQLKLFGFVGFRAEQAVEVLLENYAKHILESTTDVNALRLSLVMTALFYLSRFDKVGPGGIVAEMRTWHYAFSNASWPEYKQATEEKLKNALTHFQAALQTVEAYRT